MSRSDRVLIAAVGTAVILSVAAAAIVFLPSEGAIEPSRDQPALVFESPSPSAAPDTATEAIVVDVEGAVVAPGIRELPGGSRVADAIAAAGGYATDADLAATATAINLAQPLVDGQQIVVPRLGEVTATSPSVADGGGTGPGTGGALVNLNTASASELEGLPGIGEVTVEKIMAAREERPFASLQDAVDRGVIHSGQLEDIEGLATAG